MKNLICSLFGHKYNQWVLKNESDCLEILNCARCGNQDESKSRVNHILSDWKNTPEKKCAQIKKCDRCQEVIKQRQNHNWTEWLKSEDGECLKIRSCKVCNVKEENKHELRTENEDDCQYNYCINCDFKEVNHKHEFRSFEQEDPDGVSGGEECTICGYTINTWGAPYYP